MRGLIQWTAAVAPLSRRAVAGGVAVLSASAVGLGVGARLTRKMRVWIAAMGNASTTSARPLWPGRNHTIE
jgi:hypothetical protein